MLSLVFALPWGIQLALFLAFALTVAWNVLKVLRALGWTERLAERWTS